jgi:uncharacterized tellurite resistance protein B-like protein
MLHRMALRRFLGLASPKPSGVTRPAAGTSASETATVRRIVAELEALPAEERRYLAGFAYILSRAAHADLHMSADERREMERVVMEIGGLPEAEAVLAVEIARSQNELYGGTEDYLVTREFRAASTEEQRLQLLRCCFAVGAADRSISAEENAELSQIATELGFTREELNVVRNEYRDQIAAIQAMRQRSADAP